MTNPNHESRLPSLDVLRNITDGRVLAELLSTEELTRADIAGRTGISKPTISESVRRLVASGLLTDSGRQRGRRGRAGTNYQLRGDVGVALALSVGPDGVVVQTCDVRGGILGLHEQEVPTPATAAVVGPILHTLVSAAIEDAPGRVLGWALSMAGPIDQRTGRLVQLPNSPFLVDELDPLELVGGLASARLQVDNDVNWAALAEYHEGGARGLSQFFYAYLGHGLGGAMVTDGRVFHGSRGLAGELAHVRTGGPGGRSLRLVECFRSWDLLQPSSDVIDVPRLAEILDGRTATHRRTRDAVVHAVAGAVCSVTALLNPEAVILGGPWGGVGDFCSLVAERVHSLAAIDAQVRPALLDSGASLTGVRVHAVQSAQDALVSAV